MVTVRVQPLAFLKENCTKLISYCMYVLGIVILRVPGTHYFLLLLAKNNPKEPPSKLV